jgi:hypothetical protein
VPFSIDFGAAGAGTFTIDDSLLAAIPASGIYFGPANSIQSFEATVLGVVFDIANGGNIFAAADGLLSGVTGICCSSFASSVTLDALLTLNTCNGLPCSTSATISGQTTELQYSIQSGDASVPAPGVLALFGIGLAGLGWSRRKKV